MAALTGEEIIRIIEAAAKAGLISFKAGDLSFTCAHVPSADAGAVATNPQTISSTEAVPANAVPANAVPANAVPANNDEVDEIDSHVVKDQELAELLITSPEAYEEAILRVGREVD